MGDINSGHWDAENIKDAEKLREQERGEKLLTKNPKKLEVKEICIPERKRRKHRKKKSISNYSMQRTIKIKL